MNTPNKDARRFAAELRELLLDRLGASLQSMLSSADALLFDLARDGQIKRQRAFLDARHLLRSDHFREHLARNFSRALAHRFELPATPAAQEPESEDDLSLQGNDEVEEFVQIVDAANRAQGTYARTLQQLASRTESLVAQNPGLRDAACMSPRTFLEAFSDGLKELGTPTDARVALGKLFERAVLPKLQPLYAEAMALCDRHHLPAAAKPTARVQPSPAQPPAALDALTAGLLQRVQEGRAPRIAGDQPQSTFLPGFGPTFTDTDLASELIRATRGEALPDFGAPQLQAMQQRAGLVGRMFNQILSDSQIPASLASVVEAFRFPAIKSALADPGFFSDSRHPVRGLINDMAAMAAGTRLGGSDAIPRFEAWAKRVLAQAELDAQSVRERARSANPLPETAVDHFMQEQARQGTSRREALLQKARSAVDQELEMNTVAMQLPATVVPLLRTGWRPMMASHLLRHGPESQVYRSGMELLHRVLYALSPDSPNARTPAERAALRRDLMEALGGVGMLPERAQSLIQGLDQALDSFETRDVPGIGAAQSVPAKAAPAENPKVRTISQPLATAPAAVVPASKAAPLPTPVQTVAEHPAPAAKPAAAAVVKAKTKAKASEPAAASIPAPAEAATTPARNPVEASVATVAEPAAPAVAAAPPAPPAKPVVAVVAEAKAPEPVVLAAAAPAEPPVVAVAEVVTTLVVAAQPAAAEAVAEKTAEPVVVAAPTPVAAEAVAAVAAKPVEAAATPATATTAIPPAFATALAALPPASVAAKPVEAAATPATATTAIPPAFATALAALPPASVAHDETVVLAREPVQASVAETPASPVAETATTPVAEAAEAPAAAAVVCLPIELPTPQRLLEQLLKVGSWFRIYDRQTQGTRWLKLQSWFPQVQRASFAEFDGHNVLTIHARDLLEDLLAGRSEPIDIPPQTVLILHALRQRHTEQGPDQGNAGAMVA